MGYYNQEIEKIAARRWKRDIGSLSDTNYNRLVSSGILNHRKQIDGMNEGSANILAKNNGIFDTDGSTYEDAALGGGRLKGGNNGFIMQNNMGTDTALDLRNATLISANTEGGFGYSSITPSNPKEKAVVRVGSFSQDLTPKQERSYINAIGDEQRGKEYVEKIRQNKKYVRNNTNKTEQEYLDALAKRHEVDEVRNARKTFSKGKTIKKYYSHNSPEILYRESANVASTPSGTKKIFEKVRRGEDFTNSNQTVSPFMSETENMRRNGLEYGKKGTINKGEMKRFVDRASKTVDPFGVPYRKSYYSAMDLKNKSKRLNPPKNIGSVISNSNNKVKKSPKKAIVDFIKKIKTKFKK